MPNLATDLARVMELVTALRAAASLGRPLTHSEVDELERAITTWNTRAASGGDVAIKSDRSFTPNLEEPASLEQRARELLVDALGLGRDSFTSQLMLDMQIAQLGVVPTEAALRAITAALANQQGVDIAHDAGYLHGLSAGWNFGVSNDNAGFDAAIASYSESVRSAKATQPAGDVGSQS